jgi:thiamine biosynthesis lipoprotein
MLPSNPAEVCRRARPLLGTIVEIGARGPDASAAIEAAFVTVHKVHRLMSFHDAESDVSRINRAPAGQEVFVDTHTHRVLGFARRVSAACRGIFDVTIADVLVRHGFLPAVPSHLAHAVEATWVDLEILDGSRVCWNRPGRIDLGGIAKGYAVDAAVETLHAHGSAAGVVNAGGDLRIFGAPQPVHVRLPESPGSLVDLGYFSDCALATSGSYFSATGTPGSRHEPLVRRNRRICAAGRESATVVARDCMTADALTKVVRLAPCVAPKLLGQFDARAIIIEGRSLKYIGAAPNDGGYGT